MLCDPVTLNAAIHSVLPLISLIIPSLVAFEDDTYEILIHEILLALLA